MFEPGDEFHPSVFVAVDGCEQVVDDAVQSWDFEGVAADGGGVEVGVDEGQQIGTATDASIGPEVDGISQQFFGAHKHGEASGFAEFDAQLSEVSEVAATVLDAGDIGVIGECGDEVNGEGGADTGRHVVEHEWQRGFVSQSGEPVLECLLRGIEVKRRCSNNGCSAAGPGVFGQRE